MIEITFSGGNYTLKDEGKLVGFQSNIFDAMEMASKEASGKPFMIGCQIPQSKNGNKSFYICPTCGSTVKVKGSLNTEDFEVNSKEEYGYCAYCERDFVIVWCPNPFRPE